MDPNSLEYYDFNAEARRLQAFSRDMEKAERLDIAIQSAFNEHPVSRYVKGLPVQSPVYPAIEYLRLARDNNISVTDIFRKVTNQISHESDSLPTFNQENSTINPISDSIRSSPNQKGDSSVCPHSLDNHSHNRPSGPKRTQFQIDSDVIKGFVNQQHEYIHWCMPAHDDSRPERKGCGFVRSRSGNGIVYTACPTDHLHHCKGKRMHCWSLRCPYCMNDTALKKAIKVERQLLSYAALVSKSGGNPGQIGHWVVSPPQEATKCIIQVSDDYDELCKYVDDCMMHHGATAGTTIFHPWRQSDNGWELSPHFHILCYGHIDTTAFRKENPGWIIKKVHPREQIRSIRHTVAYLMTHMGLGMAEKDPDSVDWDLDILDMLIPGLKSKGADYTDDDREKESMGKGRMVGDLSDVDWAQWTMDRLSSEIRIRHWGGVSRGKIRTVGFHRLYRIRVCKECGCMLRTYDGTNDQSGNIVRYIQDCPVMTFASNHQLVSDVYRRCKSELRADGLTILDFSRMTPVTVSTFELGLPDNGDLIMDGPFDESDEKFLRRQDAAYGSVPM